MRDGDSPRMRPSLQPRRRSASSIRAWHVLLNGVANPALDRGGINSSPVVGADAVDATIACHRYEGKVQRPGKRMRAKERGPAGIAKTDPARKLPRGPRLIDDSIQFGSLDPAPPVPLRRRQNIAAGPELYESVADENHRQSACSTRLERIDVREPC